MTFKRLVAATMVAWLLQFTGLQVSAADHDCAMHCQSHTDKDAKMCIDHCKTGAPASHACADHCASQAQDDKDQMCKAHCSHA